MSKIDEEGAPNPSSCLTQRELATRWSISIRTLERWRAERFGPQWLLIGGSIRYRLSDVTSWEAGQTQGG